MLLYVSGTTGCLLISLMLMVWYADEDTPPVRSSCPVAALVAALYAGLFAAVVWLTPKWGRGATADVAFLIVYVAHVVLTVAMKRLLQGKPMTMHRKYAVLLPMLVVGAVSGLARATDFSAVVGVTSVALPTLSLLGMACMTLSLGDDLSCFDKSLDRNDALRLFNRVVFTLYILIGVVSWTMAFFTGMAFLVFALILTILSMTLSVWFYNRQSIYLPQFATGEEEPKSEVVEEEKPIISPAAPLPNEETSLPQKLMLWERMESRPYLTKGLTVKIVAEQIQASPRLLSEYINSQLHVNFNTYINQLRVRFVEQEMKEHPEAKLQDLATRAGFTDSSAMLKVMKKMSGDA